MAQDGALSKASQDRKKSRRDSQEAAESSAKFFIRICKQAIKIVGQSKFALVMDCFRCGERRHSSMQCPARREHCCICKKIGHRTKCCFFNTLMPLQTDSLQPLYQLPQWNPFELNIDKFHMEEKMKKYVDSYLSFGVRESCSDLLQFAQEVPVEEVKIVLTHLAERKNRHVLASKRFITDVIDDATIDRKNAYTVSGNTAQKLLKIIIKDCTQHTGFILTMHYADLDNGLVQFAKHLYDDLKMSTSLCLYVYNNCIKEKEPIERVLVMVEDAMDRERRFNHRAGADSLSQHVELSLDNMLKSLNISPVFTKEN
uniref:ORF18 protein n=1 Tax=Plutella xylostella granulovirus TaxID=98383 RepID=A0A142DWL3_9BBAC|nr:PxGV-Torf18 protein [Plutella xylostella granulovirus]QKV50179.1 ORF18 protein [Plutella xylostella granulovirus]